MAFNKERRTIGVKIETTPYTLEASLTSSDYNLRVDSIEYDPNIQMTARKIARGDMSIDASVVGKQDIKVKFRAELYPSTTGAPGWGKILKISGYAESTSSIGANYLPSSFATNVPATMEIPEIDEGTSPSQVVVKCSGVMGVVSIELKAGIPAYLNFDGQGVFAGYSERSYANRILPAITETAACPAFLGAAVLYNGKSQILDTLKLGLGNKTELYSSPSSVTGFLGTHITGARDPNAEYDPDLQTISTEDFYTNMITTPIQAALQANIGSGIIIKAPNCQIVQALKPGEREGHVTQSVKLRLCRNSGDDELKIATGTVGYIAAM